MLSKQDTPADKSSKKCNPDERKEQILNAALRVLKSQGFDKATTKAIAAEAGLAEGTLFIYFATKKDILMAAIRRIFVDPLPDVLSNESASDYDIIRSLLHNRLEMLKDNDNLIRSLMAVGLTDIEIHREFYEKISSPVSEQIMSYLQKRMEQDVFKALDLPSLSRSFLSMAIGYHLTRQILDKYTATPSYQTMLNTMTELCLNGLNRPISEDVSSLNSLCVNYLEPQADAAEHRRMARSTWLSMVHLVTKARLKMDKRFTSMGVTESQFIVLTHLYGGEGASQQELADRLAMTKGNVCCLLDRMAAAGFIERRSDPTDKRINRIFITQTGKEKLLSVRPCAHDMIDDMFGELSIEELRALQNKLETVRMDNDL